MAQPKPNTKSNTKPNVSLKIKYFKEIQNLLKRYLSQNKIKLTFNLETIVVLNDIIQDIFRRLMQECLILAVKQNKNNINDRDIEYSIKLTFNKQANDAIEYINTQILLKYVNMI